MPIPDQNLEKGPPEKADQLVSFEERLARMNELYETNSYQPEVKEAAAPEED